MNESELLLHIAAIAFVIASKKLADTLKCNQLELQAETMREAHQLFMAASVE